MASSKNESDNPNYYIKKDPSGFKTECWDWLEVLAHNKKGAEAHYVCNIGKYIWRYREKNKSSDIRKLIKYANRLLILLEDEEKNVRND